MEAHYILACVAGLAMASVIPITITLVRTKPVKLVVMPPLPPKPTLNEKSAASDKILTSLTRNPCAEILLTPPLLCTQLPVDKDSMSAKIAKMVDGIVEEARKDKEYQATKEREELFQHRLITRSEAYCSTKMHRPPDLQLSLEAHDKAEFGYSDADRRAEERIRDAFRVERQPEIKQAPKPTELTYRTYSEWQQEQAKDAEAERILRELDAVRAKKIKDALAKIPPVQFTHHSVGEHVSFLQHHPVYSSVGEHIHRANKEELEQLAQLHDEAEHIAPMPVGMISCKPLTLHDVMEAQNAVEMAKFQADKPVPPDPDRKKARAKEMEMARNEQARLRHELALQRGEDAEGFAKL